MKKKPRPKNKLSAWFQCIAGCDERYPLNEVIYKCKKCGELLEVVHDMEALSQKSPSAWKRLFEERFRSNTFPYGSGVWGKKEWVCPSLDDRNIISMYEGGTHLFNAGRFGSQVGLKDLWIKQCGNSQTGSFKDLGMTVLVSMVNQMIKEGKKIKAVACASTGDTSAALAAYCAAAGIRPIVFLPRDKVSVAQLVQPIANGAMVLSLDTDFDGCMAMVQKICTEEGIYLANSMNSLRIEGQKTVGIEIVQQMGWNVPDVIVIPGGNLGNIAALGKGFTLMKKLGLIKRYPRIILAQAKNANPLYLSYLKNFKDFKPVEAKKTLASAIQIGNPVSVRKAIKVLKEFDGIVGEASEEELANVAALADRTGMYNCPHTGVAIAVMLKLLERGDIAKKSKVVIISTAHGLKFTEFKINYHMKRLSGIRILHSNMPIELPNEEGAVRDAITAGI